MIEIADILKDLMRENEIDVETLGKRINLKDYSLIYDWLSGGCFPSLENLVKLADYFKCTIEYLLGRTENYGEGNYKVTQPFYLQLIKIMEQKGVSQYKMIKDGVCASNHFNRWLKLKNQPQLETLIKLADYFNVSVDYLIGRQ